MSPRDSTSDRDETPAVVREAWRARLYDELAEKSERRRRDSAMRFAVLAGMLLGVFGCILLYGN